jgi:hypothetical protein
MLRTDVARQAYCTITISIEDMFALVAALYGTFEFCLGLARAETKLTRCKLCCPRALNTHLSSVLI